MPPMRALSIYYFCSLAVLSLSTSLPHNCFASSVLPASGPRRKRKEGRSYVKYGGGEGGGMLND